MKSQVFEFKAEGLFRIVINGDNTDRLRRYCQRIGVNPTDELAKVEYRSSIPGQWKLEGMPQQGGEVASLTARPVFFETRYNVHIFVDDKEVTDCAVEHVMASVSDEFEYVPERNGMDGTFDFLNAPGKFTIDIAFWRGRVRRVIRLEWWVVSEKIDVRRDAELIKERVESAKSGFVYAFLTKTRNDGGLSSERNTEDRIWFNIFQCFVDEYKAAVNWVLHSPHLKYRKEARHIRADRIRRWTAVQANLFYAMPRKLRETALFRTEEIHPITDTIENRFVKHTLKEIGQRLGQFKARCSASSGTGVSRAYLNRMEEWLTDLNKLVNHAFFRPIGRFTGFRQESLALQRKRGYSKIQETWIALQHAINVMGKGLDIGNQPIWKLYEFWCFILMRDILQEEFKLTYKSGVLGNVGSLDDILDDIPTDQEIEDDTVQTNHSDGSNICRYEFEDLESSPHRLVTLTYQQSYSDVSGKENCANIVEQIPDIVLTIKDEDAEGLSYTYLFDAKYRIYSYPSRRNPQLDAAPFVTLNDMHRYRDAILYRRQSDKTLSREIIGAYVLYPGRGDKSYEYGSIIREENIGAIPLLPTKYIRNADGEKVLDANGKPQFEGMDGEAQLRTFLKEILERKTNAAHLGDGKVLPTRGTSVVVAPSEAEYLATDVVYGTYRNSGGFDQLKWIKDKKLYNMPVDKAEEIGIVDESSAKAKSMLFLVSSRKEKPSVFRIKRESATKVKQADLVSNHGYIPRKPEPEKEYWLWKLEIE